MSDLAYHRGYRYAPGDNTVTIVSPSAKTKDISDPSIRQRHAAKQLPHIAMFLPTSRATISESLLPTFTMARWRTVPPEIESFCHYNITDMNRVVFVFYVTHISNDIHGTGGIAGTTVRRHQPHVFQHEAYAALKRRIAARRKKPWSEPSRYASTVVRLILRLSRRPPNKDGWRWLITSASRRTAAGMAASSGLSVGARPACIRPYQDD